MAEQKIHLGKFINNLDSEDLSSEKLQGVVNNVYAKAVSTHKKKAKEVEEETKEQEEDTVTFIKSNHDRLKAHKNKPEKDIDKDDATAKDEVAKEINESKRPLRKYYSYEITNGDLTDTVTQVGEYMYTIQHPNKRYVKNARASKGSDDRLFTADQVELYKNGMNMWIVDKSLDESLDDEFEVARYNGNQYGIWSKTSKNWMTFGRKKDLEKRVKELNDNNPNKKLKEAEEGITPDNIYNALIKKLPAEDIDHHESDLYVRKTPKSTEIINKLTNKSLLSTFKDNIDGDIWYELPFCYTPFFGESKELTETVKSNLFQPSVDPWERDAIDTSAWVKGTISKDGAEYQVSAKVFNEPSQYGINHGRISKLWVKEKGYPVAINYDRGWVDAPPHNEDLLNTVIKELEDYRDKHPISVNESKQIPESKKLAETSIPRNASKIKVGGREFTKNDKYWSYDDKDSLTGKVNVSPNDIKRLYGNDVEVLETDPNYKPKRTKEVKVLQGNYGYGWDDLVEYDKEDSAEVKQDLRSYRENEKNAQFRVVTRRVPLGEDKLTESHNLKRNITNIKFAVKELQKKGYSHEEANDLVLKIFDEHEGDTNRSLEWYLDKVLSKADYNKEYGITEGKEKKIDLYVNGEYVCSSTRYKRVKDFVDAVKKDGKVTYAGLDNNGKLSDKVTKTIKDTDKVVGRIVTESKKLTEAKSAKKFVYNLDGRFVAHQLIGVDSKFNRPFDLAKKYRDITNDPSFKKGSIGAKHKSYRNAVNEWVKTVEPTEFIVYTKEESPSWKDDSLDVYYRKETVNESKKLTEAPTIDSYEKGGFKAYYGTSKDEDPNKPYYSNLNLFDKNGEVIGSFGYSRFEDEKSAKKDFEKKKKAIDRSLGKTQLAKESKQITEADLEGGPFVGAVKSEYTLRDKNGNWIASFKNKKEAIKNAKKKNAQYIEFEQFDPITGEPWYSKVVWGEQVEESLKEAINPKFQAFYDKVNSDRQLAKQVDYLYSKVLKTLHYDMDEIKKEVKNRALEDKVAEILEHASLISDQPNSKVAKELNALLDESLNEAKTQEYEYTLYNTFSKNSFHKKVKCSSKEEAKKIADDELKKLQSNGHYKDFIVKDVKEIQESLKEAFPTDNELNEAFKLDELQLNKFVRLVEVGKITKDEFLDAVGRLIDENSSDLKQLLRKPDENVKKWYKENYPTDSLGDNINPNLTFGELIKGINKHKDFYDLIGVGDSLVRERLFNWIAKICGVSYDTVYNKWLGESVKTKDIPHKKLMEESEGGPSLSGFKSEELDDIFKVGAKFTLKKPMELEVFIPDDWRYDWSEDGFTDKELEEIGRDFRQELEDLEQYDTKILDKYIVLDKLEGAKLELPAGFELTVAENIPNTQWFNGNPWFTEVVFDTKDGQIRQFYNSVPGPTFIAHNS